ncbi:MAG: histidinol-phosphatase [Candidatus Dormibacteraeota bacterium]|nr:histidinol-phosphatase [Candidatus Dormibacteraeota bacterium]MBV9526566.1 histidinol-phosphatase [Candidatus Dormibacteraeota bacterium]
MSEDLALAQELADIADGWSMGSFRSRTLEVVAKADLTPVTAADRAIERTIAEHLAAHRPDHAMMGEEFGLQGDAGAPWRWVIDPIDGTRSFVRGNETWATLIALQHEGETVVAVASMPALGQRYHASRGAGAAMNGAPIHVSEVSVLSDALITHTSIPGFVHTNLAERLLKLAGQCWDARGMGNSMSHLAVARGSADIGWTSRANVWDFAALALIVREAGGMFTDRSADDARLGGTGISSNGLLHDLALHAAGLVD